MNQLRIESSFPIVPKKIGNYAAFPTIVRIGERIWVACRQGITAENTPHGDGGRHFLYYATSENYQSWQCVPVSFNQVHEQPNDLDAILSAPSHNQATLVSRHYRSNDNNVPYLSILPIEALYNAAERKTPLLLDRQPVNQCLDARNGELTVAALYAHVRVTNEGEWLQPSYSTIQGDGMHSPVILGSRDNGQSWYLKSAIARSDKFGKYLNESSILEMTNGNWLAVIRTDEQPCPLYYSISISDVSSWQPIKETGFHGHSPALVRGDKGEPYLLYRDLSGEKPAIALAIYQKDRWVNVGILSEYENTYNGGYADAIALGSGRFLAVAYMDDEDACPWIQGFVYRVLIS